MFSEALSILDHNTTLYMIEQQQKEIEEKDKALEKLRKELEQLQGEKNNL